MVWSTCGESCATFCSLLSRSACAASRGCTRRSSFFTSPLPEDAAEATNEVNHLQAACNGATEAGLSSAFETRQDLEAAASRLAEAKQPVNHPVNYCFSANGTEMVAHTVQGWVEQAPEKPCTTLSSGQPPSRSSKSAPSFSRTSLSSECSTGGRRATSSCRLKASLCFQSYAQAAKTSLPTPTWPTRYRRVPVDSCVGFVQVCPIATFGSNLPVHIARHELNRRYPLLEQVSDADDTYLQAPESSCTSPNAATRR